VLRLLYSRWDGSQERYSLEAESALDELSRYLMEGLDVRQSLDWMRMQGFELAGTEFRVMGLEELIQELRQRARDLLSRFNMDETFDEHRERLDAILDREQAAVRDRHGVESQRWNDFGERRHQDEQAPPRLSERLERFRDYTWVDADAEADFRELLDRLDEMRRLEEFRALNRGRMQGPEGLSFEEALELMRQLEAMSQMMRDLLEGNFEGLPMDQLSELLGDDAAQSIMILRDLEGSLQRAGYVRDGQGGVELTPRAIRRLGELALENIYAELQRGGPGSHESLHKGISTLVPERTRRHSFGEPTHLDAIGTLRNAVRRRAQQGLAVSVPVELDPEDLEVFDTDQLTETTTVLLLDMSWSMSWSERWPAAKRVAIALDHLIRTRFPRDHFFVVGFYTRARQLHVKELPELSWNMSDPFTNLQEGLQVAQRLIDKHPSSNTQIIVITDGQPTAYFVSGELRVEWPNGYGGTSPRANRETLREVRRVTKKGITINTFMLDDAPELVRFVEGMTRINKGRAFYTTPGNIGQYVMVDYLGKKKRHIR
jgi:uncharacterized protein with von Willebrand factor type A (vWA) domain